MTADHSWAQTRDINLAAALASFEGIEFANDFPVQKFKDHERGGEEFTVFKFKTDKRVSELIRMWHDPELYAKHPEHPLTYMHAMMHNRNRLLDAVKNKANPRWHMVKKGARIYFVAKEDA